MMPLSELEKLHHKLLFGEGGHDQLEELDYESLKALLLISQNREAEINLYDELTDNKSELSRLAFFTTISISHELHGPAFNADSLKWLGLKTICIALFHAYLLEADLYSAEDVAGGANAGYKLVADRFGLKPNSYRTEWTKVKTKRARKGQKSIVEYIDKIEQYLPIEAREIAKAERSEFSNKEGE